MKNPSDSEQKLVIFSRGLDSFDTIGKFIDGEWHLQTKKGEFLPMSAVELNGYVVTWWVNLKDDGQEI